tara:strand:+ start:246 stop:875 length:630 start_codon:yes stop_codon:yes gene_type:complete
MYKPVGLTSFGVVKAVRGIIQEKKVGHGGTLDPFADGVLIIGTGADTKKLSHVTMMEKSYVAKLKLGMTTDTLDVEGKIIIKTKPPSILIDDLIKILKDFEGNSNQIPPMYSAKKVNGRRLYKLARKNITIDRDPVKIHISKIDLIDYERDEVTFSVTCSKGTYVRVLGSDIAKKAGTHGYLISLQRISVGNYKIKDSISIENLRKSWR